MRFFRTIVALIAPLAAALPALAASSADLPHVHVQLISPDAQLHPGTANRGGLYFKLEPGWHVYWKNPGDAGEPPHIKWTLPAGITAGPLQFPVPKRLPLGPLMDFGYEDEVLFPIQLNVADGAPSGPATLHAKVDWLVCRGSCIPEKTELELTRPIAAASAGTPPVQPDQRHLDSTRQQAPAGIPANLKIGFVPTPTGFRLTAITGHRETEASFFPPIPTSSPTPHRRPSTPTANGLTLDIKKDESLAANPKQLARPPSTFRRSSLRTDCIGRLRQPLLSRWRPDPHPRKTHRLSLRPRHPQPRRTPRSNLRTQIPPLR